MRILVLFTAALLVLICCTKKQGKNPSLAFTDRSLLDSCKKNDLYYYKGDETTLLSGFAGPHGTFKLRFNSTANQALTAGGQLPVGASFPEGSLIVKDVYSGGSIFLYALMYKKSGSWLWAEIEPEGKVHYSVNQDPSGCTNCHSQQGNRDLAVSFHFY